MIKAPDVRCLAQDWLIVRILLSSIGEVFSASREPFLSTSLRIWESSNTLQGFL